MANNGYQVAGANGGLLAQTDRHILRLLSFNTSAEV